MKLQIASDLHLEINGYDVLRTRDIVGDVLVLAGDIHNNPEALLKWMQDLTDIPIVYVLGNHEHYKHVCTEAFNDYADLLVKRHRTYLLERQWYDQVDVDSGGRTAFYGTTLWTDLKEGGDKKLFEEGLNDAVLIKRGSYDTIADFSMEENRLSRRFLFKVLDEPPTPNEKRIIVTHHAPGPMSIHPRFIGHPLNSAFINTELEYDNPPNIWIHGHTHSSFDYNHKGTRYICNPYGYGRENPEFRRDFVIEI